MKKTIKEFENYAVSDQGQINSKLPKRKLIAFSKQYRKYTNYKPSDVI